MFVLEEFSLQSRDDARPIGQYFILYDNLYDMRVMQPAGLWLKYLVEILVERSVIQHLHRVTSDDIQRELVPAISQIQSTAKIHNSQFMVTFILLPVGAERTDKLLKSSLEINIS